MRTFLSILFALCTASLCAQEEYGMGLMPDDGSYDQLPEKPQLLTRDYTTVPRRHSLLRYCPKPMSQQQYSTCTSWAAAYAARTIAEAVKYGWTDRNKITQEAFSPIYVYALIKDPRVSNCLVGSYVHLAMELLKQQGVPKLSSFNSICSTTVPLSLHSEAARYRIDDYQRLFPLNEPNGNVKVARVKKAISEDCPVVIGMHLTESFMNCKGEYSDVNPRDHGYHAMCVVGYDDDKNGGAFHIMNSWGEWWGDNGYVWVPYNDFARYVDQAYEMYVKRENMLVVNHDNINNDKFQPFKPRLSGEISLQLSTGETMAATRIDGTYTYRVKGSYISGTRYRIYITNNEPAYVYVIGSDLRNSVSQVFPPNDRVSAALTYKSSHVAIPDEQYYVEMDNTVGTDYMLVLYSQKALDIAAITSTIKRTPGNFATKVNAALSGKRALMSEITYGGQRISFNATTTKTLVPMIVEITHK